MRQRIPRMPFLTPRQQIESPPIPTALPTICPTNPHDLRSRAWGFIPHAHCSPFRGAVGSGESQDGSDDAIKGSDGTPCRVPSLHAAINALRPAARPPQACKQCLGDSGSWLSDCNAVRRAARFLSSRISALSARTPEGCKHAKGTERKHITQAMPEMRRVRAKRQPSRRFFRLRSADDFALVAGKPAIAGPPGSGRPRYGMAHSNSRRLLLVRGARASATP